MTLGWEDPLEKEWQPTPVLLLRKFHGWRSLVGYSPWGHKELVMTEQLHDGILTMPLMKTILKSIFLASYVKLHIFYSSKAKQITYPKS